jgi:hypothetical protein
MEDAFVNKTIVEAILECPRLLRRRAPLFDPDGEYNKGCLADAGTRGLTASDHLLTEITWYAAYMDIADETDAEAQNEALLKKCQDLETENALLKGKAIVKDKHIEEAMHRELAKSDELNASYRRELQLTGELHQLKRRRTT